MKKINDKRYFFILLSNGDTVYFELENKEDKYEIHCYDYEKKYINELKLVAPVANTIEFSVDNFVLKNGIGNTVCSLKNDYKKMRKLDNVDVETLEIEMIYMDPDLRLKLLETEQMLYEDSACNIPGLLYEPIQEQPYTRTRKK